MKTQAKHTPIPYKACKSHEDFNGPYFDIEEEDRAEYDAKPYTSIESASGIVCNAHDLFTFKPGDAEFIVKACNSHDALVEALEGLASNINLKKLDIKKDFELILYHAAAVKVLGHLSTYKPLTS